MSHGKYGFVAPLGSRLQGIPPASIRFFSQSCTKACLCSEQAGPNSHPVLKARSAQTGGPERPGREGRAFHLLFPISFTKYNWLLKKIHSARRYTLKAPISCRAMGWMILQHSRIILPIVGEDRFMRDYDSYKLCGSAVYLLILTAKISFRSHLSFSFAGWVEISAWAAFILAEWILFSFAGGSGSQSMNSIYPGGVNICEP